MESLIHLKAGDPEKIINRNAWTELCLILLWPVSLVIQLTIVCLLVLLNLVTLDTLHIKFHATPRRYRRPDGTIVEPAPPKE